MGSASFNGSPLYQQSRENKFWYTAGSWIEDFDGPLKISFEGHKSFPPLQLDLRILGLRLLKNNLPDTTYKNRTLKITATNVMRG